MKNVTKILRINGFERFFNKHSTHLRTAEKQDVRTALELTQGDRSFRNLNGIRHHDPEKGYMRGRIPNSMYFDQHLWQGIDMNKMDEKEREDLWTAFWNKFEKFKST